ncbi:hypothetical protein B4135_1938 [Caldibacillus debilis]|uniref:Uncharacterized protein n=1 Tax=Caldibacillus debilis TaxID=301148 RepID=A0A150M6H6_9BACI|nr:hypothetical protein B4135_1938 [Caldibacillus debilis]
MRGRGKPFPPPDFFQTERAASASRGGNCQAFTKENYSSFLARTTD